MAYFSYEFQIYLNKSVKLHRVTLDRSLTLMFGKLFNSFQLNVSFLYSLNKSENRRFSDVLRGYRKETLATRVNCFRENGRICRKNLQGYFQVD